VPLSQRPRDAPLRSLITADIEGGRPLDSDDRRVGFLRAGSRRSFGTTNRLDDIEGASAGSRRPGIRSGRVTDPNDRQYPQLGGRALDADDLAVGHGWYAAATTLVEQEAARAALSALDDASAPAVGGAGSRAAIAAGLAAAPASYAETSAAVAYARKLVADEDVADARARGADRARLTLAATAPMRRAVSSGPTRHVGRKTANFMDAAPAGAGAAAAMGASALLQQPRGSRRGPASLAAMATVHAAATAAAAAAATWSPARATMSSSPGGRAPSPPAGVPHSTITAATSAPTPRAAPPSTSATTAAVTMKPPAIPVAAIPRHLASVGNIGATAKVSTEVKFSDGAFSKTFERKPDALAGGLRMAGAPAKADTFRARLAARELSDDVSAVRGLA